jgi:hypothetical protein
MSNKVTGFIAKLTLLLALCTVLSFSSAGIASAQSTMNKANLRPLTELNCVLYPGDNVAIYTPSGTTCFRGVSGGYTYDWISITSAYQLTTGPWEGILFADQGELNFCTNETIALNPAWTYVYVDIGTNSYCH